MSMRELLAGAGCSDSAASCRTAALVDLVPPVVLCASNVRSLQVFLHQCNSAESPMRC
jgi:hypothetical protein